MSDVPSAFAYLHKVNLQSFGTGFKIWWPVARKSMDYSVPIAAVASPITARDIAALGALIQTTDMIVVHATKEDFPYEPKAGDLFRWGTTAEGRKYSILTAASMEQNHAHYRITAEFAST